MLVLFVVCWHAKIHTSPDIVRVLVLGFSFYFVSCSETDYIQYIQYGGKAQDFRVEAVERSFSDPNSTTNHNLLVYYANIEEQQGGKMYSAAAVVPPLRRSRRVEVDYRGKGKVFSRVRRALHS